MGYSGPLVSMCISRNAGILHRSAVTAADKLTDFGADSVALVDNGQGGGTLAASTKYYVTAIPGNRYGPTKVSGTIEELTTGATVGDTYSIRATIAQCAGAEYYDLFMSTDAAPKWLGRITEAQRAAGGIKIATVGTVTASAGVPAGKVDLCTVGTGIQTSNAVFAQSNAFKLPTTGTGAITPVNCAGKQKAYIYAKLALTDLRSAPALNLLPFLLNEGADQYHQGELKPVGVLGQIGQTLLQVFECDVDGCEGLIVAVSSISGQGAAVTIYVELV